LPVRVARDVAFRPVVGPDFDSLLIHPRGAVLVGPFLVSGLPGCWVPELGKAVKDVEKEVDV
jgi:hypothetical protein